MFTVMGAAHKAAGCFGAAFDTKKSVSKRPSTCLFASQCRQSSRYLSQTVHFVIYLTPDYSGKSMFLVKLGHIALYRESTFGPEDIWLHENLHLLPKVLFHHSIILLINLIYLYSLLLIFLKNMINFSFV